jgi:uncharacterized membrane-anchored protein
MKDVICSFLNHDEGKPKLTSLIFILSFLAHLLAWIIIFGIGGAIGISVGVCLGLITLALTVFGGIGTGLHYIDWIENG